MSYELSARRLVAIPIALSILAVTTAPAGGQQPTQARIESALAQPNAANAARERIRASGLTPEQIRARLTASGYSANLLDAFMGAASAANSATTEPLGSEQSEAILVLGIPELETIEAPTAIGRVPGSTAPPSGVFGVDVFRRNTTQFLPLLSGPAPTDYRLGPGDALVLILTGDVEAAHQLAVTREGFVVVPQVGQVYLANLTMDQARNLLFDKLGRVYSGIRRTGATTHFELAVASIRAIQVFVIGEVAQPGAYQMSALGTALTALYAAGGVIETANLRAVDIRRNGRLVATFDLYDYLLHGDVRSDVRLENGDVIFVNVRQKRVDLRGSVRRPASYDVKQGESLREALAAAGGFRADGSVSRLTIERVLPPAERSATGPQRILIDVPLLKGDSNVVPPLTLEDDDHITVYSIDRETAGYVDITGNVYLPGRIGFRKGMRLSQLMERAGGPRQATYTGRAHIARMNTMEQTRRLIAVQLPADSAAPWLDDPVLEDRDSVIVYSLLRQRALREVVISGAVNSPKRIPFVEGMTVRDLVLAADGLAPGAWIDTVEIARLPSTRSQGALAVSIRVPIDSTYLFDRDALGQYIGPPGGQFRRSGAPDFALEPWDNVVVMRQPDWELQRTVSIYGQVRFPGRYALRSRTDRLAGLVDRAGGLTPAAYAVGTEFWRIAEGRGRVGVDLFGAMQNPELPSNLILVEGDSLFIPEYSPLVQVGGAVHSPSAVLFRANRSLRDYIDAGGGFSRSADARRVYVIQPSGQIESVRRRFLLPDHHPKPLAGAVIVVPAVLPEDKKDYVSLMSSIVSIVASAVTVILVATRR